jgi:hypothetical protein
MLPGTPELFLGAFLFLGETPPFLGTLKQLLGISVTSRQTLVSHVTIPLTGNMDFFSLMGPPAYYTPIGLGASRGAPHQNQHLGRPPLFIYASGVTIPTTQAGQTPTQLYVYFGVKKSGVGSEILPLNITVVTGPAA